MLLTTKRYEGHQIYAGKLAKYKQFVKPMSSKFYLDMLYTLIRLVSYILRQKLYFESDAKDIQDAIEKWRKFLGIVFKNFK